MTAIVVRSSHWVRPTTIGAITALHRGGEVGAAEPLRVR